MGFLDGSLEDLLLYLKSAPWNLPRCKVLCKMKKLCNLDKNCLISVLLSQNLAKTTAILEIGSFEMFILPIFMLKKKNWDKNFIIWIFLDCNIRKLLSYLKLAPSDLSKRKVLCKTKNLWAWEPKLPYIATETATTAFEMSTLEIVKMKSFALWFFGLEFERNNVIF